MSFFHPSASFMYLHISSMHLQTLELANLKNVFMVLISEIAWIGVDIVWQNDEKWIIHCQE